MAEDDRPYCCLHALSGFCRSVSSRPLLRTIEAHPPSLDETKIAAEAARDGVKVARDEFNATHRPKLCVRVMKPPLTDGKIFTIHYTIVNIGERLAIPKRHEIMWYVQPASEETSVIPESRSLPCLELKAGQSISQNIHITDFSRSFDLSAGGEFKIRGTIKYEDDDGVVRRTGFLRTYNAVLNCFHASEDNGEEYED